MNFEVSGSVEYRQATFKRGVHQGTRREQYQFRAVVEGDRWSMRVTTSESPVTAYDYCEVSFDGETLYYLRSIRSWVQDQILAGKPVGANTAIGVVLKRPVPAFSENHETGPIWLTYASGDYFSKFKGQGVLCPLTRSVGPKGHVTTLDAHEQEARVSIGQSLPEIPVRIDFLETNMGGVNGVALTNATFEILSYTNAGELRLPLKSVVKTFGFYREPGTPTATLIVRDEYELTTGFIGLEPAGATFVPVLSEVTDISDLRFEAAEKSVPVFYYQRQGSWPLESDVRRSVEYKTALRRAHGGGLALSGGAIARSLLLLIALATLPVLAVAWKRRKRRATGV